tara:strand:- start:3258 stop:4049 length:792 start_codon:yes stop_codon:yes gene_type:complete
MAKAPERRKRGPNAQKSTRRVTTKGVGRAKSAVAQVDATLNSTVSTMQVDATFRSHSMIKLIGDHWSQVNKATFRLARFLPVLHNQADVKAVADILDAQVEKLNKHLDAEKRKLDAIEGEVGTIAKIGTEHPLVTQAKITSRLGVKVFAMMTKADDLLHQAERLWLLDHMSDDASLLFTQQINKRVRAVCVSIRTQDSRLINQLRSKRDLDSVRVHDEELKKAGVNLSEDDVTPEAGAEDSEVAEEKDAEQVSEKEDKAVAAE